MALFKQSVYQEQMFKLLIIGDSGVGKTCVLLKFCEDTAGQERFKTITTTYYKGAHGVILVYDVTDEKSFNSVGNWIKQIEQNASEKIIKVLVGNKCDKLDQKVIQTERGQKLAQQYEMLFFETSAKNDINIMKTFEAISRLIQKNKQATQQNVEQKGVQLNSTDTNRNKEEKKECCKI